jgi:pyruvate dehydrogenase E1 component beta subunit
MVHECLRAAEVLARDGVEAEVIDLRSVRPWDVELVCERVRRTGRLVVADTGWTTFGISAEIAARVGEELFGALRAPVRRVGLPPVPTPCAPSLERVYYPTAEDLVRAARSTLHDPRDTPDGAAEPLPLKPFQGPF